MENLSGQRKTILVLGGGFAGAYCAQRLSRRLDPRKYVVTVVDRNNYLTFYPLLIEAGVGVLEPRHAVAPIRRFLSKGEFRMAEVLSGDLAAQQIVIRDIGSDKPESIHYDHLVFGLGSVTKVPPIPGLLEFGFQVKSLADAVEMRDRGIRLLELANTLKSSEARRKLLSIVVVGANFTGVEFAGEYQAFLREACHDYRNVDPNEVRMVLLEYADRILPAMSEKLANWCLQTLRKRGVDVRTKTSIKEVGVDYCIATDGQRIPTETVVWAAGIAPSPIIARLDGMPTNEKGYIPCDRALRVQGFENVWAIGDSATVLDENGKPYAATAQNARREGMFCGRNIEAALDGQPVEEFKFDPLGSFAAIGHRQAAADVMGLNITGFLGWFIYRSAYLFRMPRWSMKIRLMADWTTSLLFRNEPVQLGVHQSAHLIPEHEQQSEPAESKRASLV